MPDPTKPEEIDLYHLDHLLNPAIKKYIQAKGMITFPIGMGNLLPNYVWKDIKDNGAIAVLPVSFYEYINLPQFSTID